jgi:DNA polymerase I-like protein with 3'-5' exonuclease and polymerase domains
MVKKATGSTSKDLISPDVFEDPKKMKLYGNCIFDVDEAIKILNSEPSIALDLETTGLRPWKDKIAVIALYGPNCKKSAILHRKPGTEYPARLLEWLAAPMPNGEIREYVTHNGVNFDIPFLHAAGMDVFSVNWWDTLISEQVTVVSGRKNIRFSLKETQRRRLGRASKKEIDHRSWQNENLSDEQIDYVLADIEELHKIKKTQVKTCESDRKQIDHETGNPLYHRTRADHLRLEMDLLPIVVQMTCNGVPIQLDLLREFVQEQQTTAEEQSAFIQDKLGEINIGSPAQLKKALLAYGVFIENTQAQTILDLSYEHEGQELGDVCRAITLFKHAQQRVNMFSKKYEQDYIIWRPDRNFHFVHPRFRQLGTDTGRFSCIAAGSRVEYPRDLEKHPEGMPIENVKSGMDVYSFDNAGRPCVRKVEKVWERGISKVLTLKWKSRGRNTRYGELKATPDHRIRLADGTWKRMDELYPGDKLCFLSRKSHLAGGKYPQLGWNNALPPYQEHMIISPTDFGYEVHHKDHRPINNSPSNLIIMSSSEHRKYHAQFNPITTFIPCPYSKEMLSEMLSGGIVKAIRAYHHDYETFVRWASEFDITLPSSKDLKDCSYTREEIEEALTRGWGEAAKKLGHGHVVIKRWAKAYGLTSPKKSKKGPTKKKCPLSLEDYGSLLCSKSIWAAAADLKVSHATARRWAEEYGFLEPGSSSRDLLTYPSNHVVIDVIDEGDSTLVYDLMVEEYHNFVVEEVCVANSSEPNLQQIPKTKNEALGEIGMRHIFGGFPDHKIISIDFSQIEVRCAAIVGKDLNLIAALQSYDIHSYVAAKLFKIPESEITPAYWKTATGKRQRQAAKAATFCLIFGGSPPALQSYAKQYGVNMSLNEATYIHYNFFELFPGLKMMRDRSYELARKRSHTIELPTGLRRNLIRVQGDLKEVDKDGDPLTPQRLMNTEIQGTAAIGLKSGLLELATRPYRNGSLADLLVAVIHDEVLAVVPEDDAEIVAPQMQDALVVGMHKIVNRGKYKVPIVAEVTIGDTWAG